MGVGITIGSTMAVIIMDGINSYKSMTMRYHTTTKDI